MRALLWLVGLALLLTGCASEKGIIDKEGYQLDTRHRAQAAYPRIKVLVIHYTAENLTFAGDVNGSQRQFALPDSRNPAIIWR